MEAASDSRSLFRSASLTVWSLAALVAGLLLGVLGRASGGPAFETLAGVVKPIGDLWISALLVMVLPLAITQVLAAITDSRGSESAGAVSARAVLLFLIMLGVAGLATIALARPIIALYPVDAASVASMQAAMPVPEAARQAVGAGTGSLTEWLSGLIPRNLFDAAVRGDLLPLLLFSVLFATAVSRLPGEYRVPLARTFQGLARATMLVVRWMLWGTPAGVFALTYVLALRTGGESAGMLAAYVLIVSGLLLLFTLILYPVTTLLGSTTAGAFARAAAAAQLVAVSTRSSIAALPALVEGGRRHLDLPASSTSLVLPLGVSLFKFNRTISSPVKLLFLAHVYGIPMPPATVATFVVTVIILSFTSVGLPGGGVAFKTLPAYLAAGVPIEGVVILEAVETIPDIFKTVLNVTADMSAAVLLSRSSRSRLETVTATPPAAEGVP
jgi:proton glutamate symport protein